MIIDTHAHYDDEAFDTDREALLTSMYDGGIEKIVNVCASVGGFQDTVKLMEKYPFVYGAVGIHPDDADKMTQETLDEIRRLSHMDKMVAIGEIGLDYYWHKEEEEHQIQKKMFRAQLDIAREEKLPTVLTALRMKVPMILQTNMTAVIDECPAVSLHSVWSHQ